MKAALTILTDIVGIAAIFATGYALLVIGHAAGF
jgi:hypothetical protein